MFQFKWFEVEVLQAMEKNVKLDVEYIEVSWFFPRIHPTLPVLYALTDVVLKFTFR